MATLRAEVLKTAHFDGYFHPFALDALTFHSKTTQFAIYARYECVSIDRSYEGSTGRRNVNFN